MDDKRIYFGGAVKALGDGIVEGYLVPFTSREQPDLHDEYFDAKTNLHLSDYPLDGLRVLYHHALDETIGVNRVGKVIKSKVDDVGAWVQAQLDLRNDYEKMIYDLAKSGKLGWSSGALPQSVKVSDDGHIEEWCVIEASLTPTPAMPIKTQIQTLKSLTELTPREATPIEESDEPAQTGDVEQRTKSVSKTDTSLGEDRMGNLRTRLKEMMGGMVDSIIEEIVGEFAGEIPPEDVAAVADEVLSAADEAGVDLAPLEDPNAVAMMDEEEYKADTPEDEEKAKSVRKAARFVADTAIKSVNTRIEKRRQGVGKFAKSAIEAAKAQPGKSVRDTAGGFNMKPNGNATNGHIKVSENLKYAHMTADEMMVGYMMLQAAKNPTKMNVAPTAIVSEDYLTHMAHKAQREVVQQDRVSSAKTIDQRKMAIRDELAVKAALPWKADELDASDIATQGAEWVGVLYGTQLWEKARQNLIFDSILSKGIWQFELGQGEGSAVVPLEDDDPIAYTATQANSLDSTGRPEVTANVSRFVTGNKTVTPAEVKIATAYTVTLEEDSVIALAPQVERQLQMKAQETLEQALLNGDQATAANTNINLIDGTPATGLYKPYYLAVNGALKLALVTAPAASVTSARSAGGALAISDYLATIALFPRTIQSRKDSIVMVIDQDVENATRLLPELLTYGANGERTTIYTGNLGSLFNVDVLTSGFMELANNAGKVPVAGGTLGRMVALYAPYWAWVWKRNISLESDRDIMSGTNVYVLSMRFAFEARGNTAATASYNVGISLS